MRIRLLLAFGRTGGTLLSRCLGAMNPDSVLLSEINPSGCGLKKYDFYFQLKSWYGLDVKKEKPFNYYLSAVIDFCARQNRSLIIRDFSESDFMGDSATMQLNHLDILSEWGEILPIALVRDPIDTYISRKFQSQSIESYYHFLSAVKSHRISVVKYEDLCQDTEITLKRVCSTLDLSFNKDYIKFYQYHKVTGDNNYLENLGTRSNQERSIKLYPRKRIPIAVRKRMLTDPYLAKVQNLFSYEKDFFHRPLEPAFKQLKVECKYYLKKLLRHNEYNQ